MAVPYVTYAAAIQSGVGLGNSASFTFTVSITNAWEIRVPVQVFFPTNVSAGPQISVYRSTDGGVHFDTVAMQPVGIARQSGGNQQVSLKLENGMYACQVLVGGGSTATWTVIVNTQEILTAVA